MMSVADHKVLSIGDVARHFGVLIHEVNLAIRMSGLPARPKFGNYRTVWSEDLPSLERALRARGYISANQGSGGPDNAA